MRVRILTMLGALLLLVMVLGVACSGDSDSGDKTPQSTEAVGNTESPAATRDPNATADPNATPPPDGNGSISDATPTEDLVADETRRTIRDIERSVRRLSSLVGVLGRRVGLRGGFAFGEPEDQEANWFDECCDDSVGDFNEELRDISRSLPELVEIYEEAGEQESLVFVERIGTESANIEASLSVLAALPSHDAAPAVLEEISLEIMALADAVSNLR